MVFFMNKKQGMGLPLIIAAIAGLFVAGGVVVYNMQPEEEKMMEEGEAMMEKGEEMMEEGEAMMEKGEEMVHDAENMMEPKDGEAMKDDSAMEVDGDAMMEEEDSAMEQATNLSFAGERLAGSEEIPLLEFNEADYKAALESDKLIALFFYASWCPSCRLEFPKMEKAFDGFTNENVVGFRVNYKDGSTSDFEEELAKEFGVGYQHTKVFIKNGERILKSSPQGWSTDEYISNINEHL